MRKRLKRILPVIKVIFLIIPFIWIFSRINFGFFIDGFSRIQWWTIPVLFSSVLLAMFLQGIRWWMLLRAFTPGLALSATLSYHFKSLYYSIMLPNSTAQEVVRTVFIARDIGHQTSWSAAWVGKIQGLLISLGLSFYGLFVLSKMTDRNVLMGIITITTLLLTIAVAGSFSKKVTRPIRLLVIRFLPEKILTTVESIREGIYRYRTKKRTFLFSLMITVCTQIILITGTSLTIKGVTGQIFFLECLAFIPLIEIVSMLQPFTPSGIGVRDALYALMFARLHLSEEQLGIYVVVNNLSIVLKFTGAVPILYDWFNGKRKEKLTENET